MPEPELEVPDVASSEQKRLREEGIEVALPERLSVLRDHILGTFSDLETLSFRGELTLLVRPEQLVEVVRFCRDDPAVACEYLMDLSGVHWPGGTFVDNSQETTGWPTFEIEREGRIEVDYILYSITHNHRFRLRVSVPDDDPVLPSVTGLYRSADFMEREAYDFFGVRFEGHPNLRRIEMPDDWEGHPQRKDYPLGGVNVRYKGAIVPPPDERKY